MGTKVHLPGYHPMVDLNDDSNNISTWPVYHGENKPFNSGQFHDLKTPRTIADAYFGYHAEAVKQKMLEHEATFQTQLRELHRVYRVQRELMDDLKMNELQKQSMALDTSMSSCSASQQQDAPRWLKSAVFPFSCSSSAKPAVLGAKDFLSAPIFSSGKSLQNGLGSPNNTGNSKDSEVEILEYRPLKAKRKFDIELRANEYIDVEEPKPHGVSSYPVNRSCEDPRSGSGKMLLGQSIKISGWDEARQNRGKNGLAHLNGQIRIQGMNSSSLNFNRFDYNFRSKPQVQTHPGDYMHNSYSGHDDSRRRNLVIAQKEDRRGWSHMLDAARSNGHTTAFSLNSLPENIDFFNKDQDSSYWKEGSEGGPKHSGICSFGGISIPLQSDRSFFTYNAPWNNSGSCVTQKSVTADMHPCFNSTNTLPKSFAASNNRVWPLSEGWHINSDIGIGAAYQNRSSPGLCATSGIYAASAGKVCLSGSKNLKGLTNVDASSAKRIDLNVANGGDGHEYVDSPKLNRAADLPWLKASAGLKNGNVNGNIQSSGSSSRIMGVPIFGETHLPKGASSCQSSFSKSYKKGTVRGFDMNLPCEDDEKDEKISEMPSFCQRNHIDLNLCGGDDSDDGALRTTRGFDLEAFGDIKDQDIRQLNQQIPEIWDEGLAEVAAEAIVDISSSRKLIPLAAAPDVLDWFVDIISSCPNDADKVDQLSSGEKEETDSADCFEYMTLNLPETAKEEYLPDYPNPPVPDESTTAGPYTVRTRKGQARRGRSRRDFQSDILPGLTSLARHEVTEDLQTLGGLMRTMGQSWQSTLTQRTRPRRGRPRLTPVQPPYLTSSPHKRTTTTVVDGAARMADHRSLTEWGKTTRRPRGQRCATGNASALHIA